MDKTKIKEAIKVYLNEDKSDYAIMLNGKWGSGKTYFVKNELINHIQNKDERQVIYISLFGITSIDELYNNISLHLVNIKANEYAQKRRTLYEPNAKENKINTSDTRNISFLSTVISKGLNILPEAGVIKSLTADINNKLINFNRYIFMFDDLERSSLGYDTLLGFFDKIADQSNLKAILVCNEDKIKEKDKEDFYKNFKEKVVGLTIEYSTDMQCEFDNIVECYVKDADIRGYIQDNKERILNLFKSADSCNLRTLIFACKRFSELYEKIKETYIKYDVESKFSVDFFREILLAVVGSSILIKEQHKNNEFKDQEKILASVINDKNDKFYYSQEEQYCAYKFTDEYLKNYYFNQEVLDVLLPEYVKYRNLIEQDKIKSELISIYYIDDDTEALDKLNIVLNKINNNEININIYSEILNELFTLCSSFFNNEYIDRLKEKIKYNVLNRLNEFNIDSWSIFDCSDQKANLFKNELYFFIQDEKEKINIANINMLFEIDNKTFIEEFKRIMKNRKLSVTKKGQFISVLDLKRFLEKIKVLNAKEIEELWKGFTYVYKSNITNLKEFYYADKEFFKELKEKIESELLTEESSKSKMQKLRLEKFCGYLDTIYNKL